MFVYGLVAYLVAVRAMIYLVGFSGNIFVPKSVDSAAPGGVAAGLAVDAALLAIFGVSHSLMARRAVKDAIVRLFPAPVERSTYVLVSSLALALLVWQWRSIPHVIWEIGPGPARWGIVLVSAGGWAAALVASHSLGHFDLHGVRPAWRHARGRELPEARLATGGLYGFVRHPMDLGFVVGIWATPRMTAGHLLFAAGMTAYLAIGMRFEERDLDRRFGSAWRDYRARVGIVPPVLFAPRLARIFNRS